MAVASTPPLDPLDRYRRRPRAAWLLAFAAGIVTFGLALVGTGHADPGAFLLFVGWLSMAVALHRFGRAG